MPSDTTPTGNYWNTGYRDLTISCMGGPSNELVEIMPLFPSGGRAVEIGAGEGRNSLFLAARGFNVSASDISPDAALKMRHLATVLDVPLSVDVAGIDDFTCPDQVDVFLAQTVLHFVERDVWLPLIRDVQQKTKPGGVHLITSVLPHEKYPIPEEILLSGHKASFSRGELDSLYPGWQILRSDHYVKWDSHPGIPIHAHVIEKFVARKPCADDHSKVTIVDLAASGTLAEAAFLPISLGLSKTEVLAIAGKPERVASLTLTDRVLGGNNDESIVDEFTREEYIYGEFGLQFSNDKLVGKYRYFTTPVGVSVTANVDGAPVSSSVRFE